MKRLAPFLAALILASGRLAGQQALEFQPKVGAIGARILVKGPLPPGAQVRFGTRAVPVLQEEGGFSFLVPPGSATSFVEVLHSGRSFARSAVPVVVTGTSLVSAPRLIGLKEAIDVFGYSETVPEGAKPVVAARPVLRLDDEDVLTIGETAPGRLAPAVSLGDVASMANQPMCCVGLTLTARAPKKRYQIPPPSPAP